MASTKTKRNRKKEAQPSRLKGFLDRAHLLLRHNMALDLIADKNLLILSINNFSKKYHIDFFTTKNLSENYLRHINEPSALALAENFGRTLCAWGAGRRKAPKIKSYSEITSALLDISVIEAIKFFSCIRITDLKIIVGAPQFGNTAISIEDFRKRALNSLRAV